MFRVLLFPLFLFNAYSLHLRYVEDKSCDFNYFILYYEYKVKYEQLDLQYNILYNKYKELSNKYDIKDKPNTYIKYDTFDNFYD